MVKTDARFVLNDLYFDTNQIPHESYIRVRRGKGIEIGMKQPSIN